MLQLRSRCSGCNQTPADRESVTTPHTAHELPSLNGTTFDDHVSVPFADMRQNWLTETLAMDQLESIMMPSSEICMYFIYNQNNEVEKYFLTNEVIVYNKIYL